MHTADTGHLVGYNCSAEPTHNQQTDLCLLLVSLSSQPLLPCSPSDGNGVFKHQQSRLQPIMWVKPPIYPGHRVTCYLAFGSKYQNNLVRSFEY